MSAAQAQTLPPLRCPCCQLPQSKQYCSKCLQEGIATHHTLARGISSQLASSSAKAAKQLDLPPNHNRPAGGINNWRIIRAQVAAAEKRCSNLQVKIALVEKDIQLYRTNKPSRNLQQRKERITLVSHSRMRVGIEAQIDEVKKQQKDVSKRLTHARRVLVREVVEVFGVRQRREWEIAGFALPSPDTFRLHSSTNINAALIHTIHLLSLITEYLSIALPFHCAPSAPTELPHVGRPVIRPNVPFVGTTKWREKNVLWMSSTASLSNKMKGASPTSLPTAVASAIARSNDKHRQTLTSFALLAHSVAYLAWTQGVPGIGINIGDDDMPSDDNEDETNQITASKLFNTQPQPTVMVSATSVLQLISALTDSPMLGNKTHEPGLSTGSLRHLGFSLNVSEVVAAVLQSEEKRWGCSKPTERPVDNSIEDWDLLDGEND